MASSKQLDDLNRMLECPICLERIVDPRILHCLHSFCHKCLVQHMEKRQENGLFPCPTCKTESTVPEDGGTGFKKNFFLREIGELFHQGSEVKCDVCKVHGNDVDAALMCLQCRDHLCKECAQFHCRTKFTASHTVVSLEEVQRGEHFDKLKMSKPSYCPVHDDKVLEICCKKCIKPVCSLCTVSGHKNHEMQTIKEAVTSTDNTIQNLLGPWLVAAEHYKKLCEERNTIVDEVEKQWKDKSADVEQIYNSLKEEMIQKLEKIEEEKTAALEKLEQEAKVAKKQAQVALSEAELKRLTVTSTVNYTQNLLESAEDVERLQQYDDIKNRLKSSQLKNIDIEASIPLISLKPTKIKLPDLSVAVAVTYKSSYVSSGFTRQKYSPVQHATRTTLFSTNGKKCITYRCQGLFINNDWVVSTEFQNANVKVFQRDWCFASNQPLFELNRKQQELINPRDVTCNRQKDIFVTDSGFGNCGVLKYDSKGNLKGGLHNIFQGSGYIACDDDKLVVTDQQGGRLIITDFDLNIKQVIDKTSLGLDEFNPFYVCVNNKGHLVVSDIDKKCVYVIDHTVPAVLHIYTDPRMQSPHGVCVDVLGNILVVDKSTNNVLLIDTQGNVSSLIKQKVEQRIEGFGLITPLPVHQGFHFGTPPPVHRVQLTNPTGIAVSKLGEVAVLESSGDVQTFKYLNMV